MLADYLQRGAAAGAVGGLAYGAFVALVGTPMVSLAESFETGQETAAASVQTGAVSVSAGVVWGVLLGAAVFGLVRFLLEPRLPGRPVTQAFVLAAAGFITVSGAPWLLLPPQPPGVETTLPTSMRLGFYGVMALLGAVACAAGVALYGRLRDTGWLAAVLAGIAPIGLLVVAAVGAPAIPASGPAPASLVTAFRWTTIFGQVFMWVVIAAAAAWIDSRLADSAAIR